MAEKSSWWRTFSNRSKTSTGSQEGSVVQHQESSPDTHPTSDKAVPTGLKLPQEPEKGSKVSGLLSEETFDDSQAEPVFSEKSSRRNLKVSRSGRFREKRKVRASIPENYQGKSVSGKEESR